MRTLKQERRQTIRNRCSEVGRFKGLGVKRSLIIIARISASLCFFVFFLTVGNKLTEIWLNLIYWVLFSCKVLYIVHCTKASGQWSKIGQKPSLYSLLTSSVPWCGAKSPWIRDILFCFFPFCLYKAFYELRETFLILSSSCLMGVNCVSEMGVRSLQEETVSYLSPTASRWVCGLP